MPDPSCTPYTRDTGIADTACVVIWDGVAYPCKGDDDGDGHANDVDCKPSDPSAHPGALEQIPGVDQDCDCIPYPVFACTCNGGVPIAPFWLFLLLTFAWRRS